MVDCSCSISVDADVPADLCKKKVVKARKTHRCCEINQTCVAKLTPRARGMVCDIIERTWQDREESGWYD